MQEEHVPVQMVQQYPAQMMQAPVEVITQTNATPNVVGAAGTTVVVVSPDSNQSAAAPPMFQEVPPTYESTIDVTDTMKAELWSDDK